MSKLALGTVQFGLDYGINNPKGRIPKKEVFDILDLAKKNNINILDTASAYGESEVIIGEYLKTTKDTTFKIISKVPEVNQDNQLLKCFNQSLDNLNCTSLHGYLFHNFQSYRSNPSLFDGLKELKSQLKIKKIGFSLYYPSELEYLLKKGIDFDIAQVPYNIFDQRFEQYFGELRDRKVEIHARSIFLQGLAFKKVEELDNSFKKLFPKIKELNKISNKLNVSPAALCLAFGIINENIDRVIIGVDSANNLEENIDNTSDEIIKKIKKYLGKLRELREDDENIILPFNWTKR